jgi:hypothetical protein
MVRQKHIGFVYQFHHLLPEFTATENIMLPQLVAGTIEKAAKDAATTAGTGVAAAYEYQVGRYFYYQAYLAETAPFECALIEWYLTCADQYGARAVTYYDTGVRNFNEAEAAYAGIGNPPDFDQVYLAALTAKLGYLNTQFWCPEAVLQLDGCVTCTLYAAQLMDRFVP